jgi:hypothetical protein
MHVVVLHEIIIPLTVCALYISCTIELAIVLRAALDRQYNIEYIYSTIQCMT